MTPDAVLRVAEAGAAAGCKEALFTLGDKPELRYRAARESLDALGHDSTLSYLAAMAALVLEKTTLLPHLNPGVLDRADLQALRAVSASQGMMLESAAERLSARGGPHYGSPDKRPAVRLETLRLAGEASVPFTSGILIGIGETREERIEALLALRDAHDAHGHVQEIIVQNFRAKPGTRMADAPEPGLDELLWTIAAARILFGPEANIQAPPNLSPGVLPRLVAAGINDWGGVSPVTQDYVNPEAPWPHLDALARETAAAGKTLAERLTVYPAYALAGERWLAPALRERVLRMVDSQGYPRTDGWIAGAGEAPPERLEAAPALVAPAIDRLLARAEAGEGLGEDELVRLFAARGAAFDAVCAAADQLRARVSGAAVSYVVNRNINYTNVCYFRCQFCAFSKGKLSENLRGRPYDLPLDEIVRRACEAWERGATEVCLQGGIHPDYTGETYLAICRAIKAAQPAIHIHAFSPLEIWQGAATLRRTVPDFLAALQEAGLGSLPGTAAEILDDEVRAIICPDKIATDQWLAVMEAAHSLGLRTTATIMFGHVDEARHWARHLARVRDVAGADGRLYRVRAAPLRRDGGAALSQGARPPGADMARGGAHACGGAARAAPRHRQHPDLVGQDGAGGGCGQPPRRRQRYRRHADERIDHPRRRREPRPGVPAGPAIEALAEGLGTHAGTADHALPKPAPARPPQRRTRRGAARPCGERARPALRAPHCRARSAPPRARGRCRGHAGRVRGGGTHKGEAATNGGLHDHGDQPHELHRLQPRPRDRPVPGRTRLHAAEPLAARSRKFIEQVVGVDGADIEVAYLQAPGHRLELIEYRGPADRVAGSSRAPAMRASPISPSTWTTSTRPSRRCGRPARSRWARRSP